jgi:peptide deformylase
MSTTIIQRDTEAGAVLRSTAEPVPVADITSRQLQHEIADMQAALQSQEDGVALAAPQIGISKRMFVVAPEVPRIDPEKGSEDAPLLTHTIYINPEITKRSRKTQFMDEGCLSIRYKYGKVERAEKVTIRAYDELGERFERGAGGLLAQIFQHETDHLDGMLFTDKASNVRDIPPRE